jgi:exodeoxyribonuclease III
VLRIATANVNGIRAAERRGMGAWLAERQPDILCLQEVRADDATFFAIMGEGWYGVHEESGSAKGRAGVAVLSRTEPVAVRSGLGEFVSVGRWVEADLALAAGTEDEPRLLTVVSVYIHTGEAETPKQEEKYRFMADIRERMNKLAADGRHVLVCGDFNIAHREADLKNWKGNLKKSGFLPAERAWMDSLLVEDGFVDVHRKMAGEGLGPYTWYSWRGKAWDFDSGWRIDYLIASPSLADSISAAEVDKAATYAERWSDHSPVVADFDLKSR